MYCTECGARLEEGALFCCECGNKVEQPADAECMTEAEKPVTHPEPPPVPQREQTASTAPKKPMSRKKKKALIIAGAIIAFIILGSVVMRSVFTPERLVEKFIDAMEYGDYGVLTAVACPRSDKTGLTEETAEALFALYNGNGAYRNAMEETLENQAYLLKHGKKINVEEEWEPLFSIKSTDFLLFSLYKVEIGEVELDIYTSFPNSKVTVLGKTEISYPQSYSDYRASGESEYGYTDEALNPTESTILNTCFRESMTSRSNTSPASARSSLPKQALRRGQYSEMKDMPISNIALLMFTTTQSLKRRLP